MKQLLCRKCGYANFAENIKCEKCGASLFGDPDTIHQGQPKSTAIKDTEENRQYRQISFFWYALAMIVPNVIIRIALLNRQIPYIESHFASVSAYIIGACVGTIIIVSIICGIANLLARAAKVESSPFSKFVVTVVLAYVVYWGLMLFL